MLEIIRDMLAAPFETRLLIRDITSWMVDRHSADYQRPITGKWIGWIIRKKLKLKTIRSHGQYLIDASDVPKLERLYERYRIDRDPADTGNPPGPSGGSGGHAGV